MPRIAQDATPKYRKHKASGQAIVTLSGQDHYLGPYGTRASRLAYDRLVSEWIANGRTAPTSGHDASVMELMAAYLRHGKEYYRGSSEYDATLASLRPLKPAEAEGGAREDDRSGPLPQRSQQTHWANQADVPLGGGE